jgi:molybdate transport system substrate-binding protein
MNALKILSGGAAQGLLEALAPAFQAEAGCSIDAEYGAVGTMKVRLLAGAACDLVVLTAALIDELVLNDWLAGNSRRALGRVSTGVAVTRGAALPNVGDPDSLATVLANCGALYVPHLSQSTAGRHVANMLDQLSLRQRLEGRIREFPSGNVAMAALAQDGVANAIGCTQATEIRFTTGVQWAGALPAPFALDTDYHVATVSQSYQAQQAGRFAEHLAGTSSTSLRLACGFAG